MVLAQVFGTLTFLLLPLMLLLVLSVGIQALRIEPYRANAFTQKTKSGSSLLKNEYLEHALDEIDQNTDEVWKSIITNRGSCTAP